MRVILFAVTFDDTAPVLPRDAAMIAVRRKGALRHIPPSLSFGEPKLITNVERVRLVYANGEEIKLPTEQSQMNYYCRKTKLQNGCSLSDAIERAPLGLVELGQSRDEIIKIEPEQRVEPPDTHFFPSGIIAALKITIVGRLSRPIHGNTRIDPGLITHPVIYTNVLTGEASRFTVDQLPLGAKRVSVGKFYCICHPLNYYYCDRIQGDQVRWHLIESFQNAQKLTGTFTQNVKYSNTYIPVTDKKTLDRLQSRLEEYLQRSTKKM